MSNVTVTLDTTVPADSDFVSAGAGAIRSFKTTFQSAFSQEHWVPEGSGPAGAHKAGSARAYVGTASQISSSDTPGRVMYTSDTSRLYYVGSEGTNYIGGRQAVEGGGTLSLSSRWQLLTGTSIQTLPIGAGALLGVVEGAVFSVTVQASDPTSSAGLPIIASIVAGSGSAPLVYLFNPDGSAWSGSTVTVHAFAMQPVAQ